MCDMMPQRRCGTPNRDSHMTERAWRMVLLLEQAKLLSKRSSVYAINCQPTWPDDCKRTIRVGCTNLPSKNSATRIGASKSMAIARVKKSSIGDILDICAPNDLQRYSQG